MKFVFFSTPLAYKFTTYPQPGQFLKCQAIHAMILHELLKLMPTRYNPNQKDRWLSQLPPGTDHCNETFSFQFFFVNLHAPQ